MENITGQTQPHYYNHEVLGVYRSKATNDSPYLQIQLIHFVSQGAGIVEDSKSKSGSLENDCMMKELT